MGVRSHFRWASGEGNLAIVVPLGLLPACHSVAVDGSCYTERPSGKAMLDVGEVLVVTTRTEGGEQDVKMGRRMRWRATKGLRTSCFGTGF